MFKNVIVGVDGRPGGRDAIALASQLTDPDATITLVHVHPGTPRQSGALSPAAREEREASERLLQQERASTGIDAALSSSMALRPARGLHELAEEKSADLLVVGSCSRGPVGQVMSGDDTLAALNGAFCAVAVAVSGYAEHARPIAKVGVGCNSTPESKAALAVARRIAAATDASVHALEVIEIPSYAHAGLVSPVSRETVDEIVEEADNRMASLKANTGVKGLPDVHGSAVHGLPGEQLAALGGEMDLLVVGSRSYGPFQRMMLGSTSDYLEHHARCSLLVLPRTRASVSERSTPTPLPASA